MDKQGVLDLARLDLKDDAKERYTDDRLAALFDDVYAEVRKNRPDLFIGTGLLLAEPAPLGLDDEVKLPRTMIARMARSIAGLVLLRDDEVDGKNSAEPFLQLGQMP